jgi:lysophospholipase L1-like esterase
MRCSTKKSSEEATMRNAAVVVAMATLVVGSVKAGEETVRFSEFDRRAKEGERLTVAFFGASLTWGANASDPLKTSYRARVAEKLEAQYPQARFRFVDGAIGGTGSELGVFRLQRDCLAYKPDLVFLDFSANDDIHNPKPERLASYESLVRRIVTEGRCPLVIVAFPFKWDAKPGTADAMAGRLAHLTIAEAYGVPVGDAIVHIQNLTAADPALPERLWVLDGAHPCDEGYSLFADAAWQGFRDGMDKQRVCAAPAKMLHADTYMAWSRNRLSQWKGLPACWAPALVSRTSAWFDGLMSRWLDDVVVVSNFAVVKDPETKKETRVPVVVEPIKFRATSVLVFGEETIKSGKYRAFIDGELVTRPQKNGPALEEFDLSGKRFGGGRQHYAMIAMGLDPAVNHTLEIRPVFVADEVQELRLESICLAGGEATLLE